MRRGLRIAVALIQPILSGCTREPSPSAPEPVVSGAAGLVEITITGIGTAQQRASARGIRATPWSIAPAATPASRPWNVRAAAAAVRLTTLPDTAASAHDGTVELVPVSTASFTFGTRGSGGYRYVTANFKVRNATKDSVPYGDARINLTFIAVNATGSLSGTAISRLERFDGTDITTGLETQIQPTGWAALSRRFTITATGPDVLQIYTEAEIAATPVPANVTSILPYGFVVSNPGSSNNRMLDANPGPSQFDGQLTVAYRIPLQATAADDPFTITGVFLPADDAQAWVTQSFEDTDAASVTALAARATALGASLRGVIGPSVGAASAQLVCRVRSGGTAGSPTGFMVDSIAVAAESPDPFSGGAGFIDSTAALSASFSQKMIGAGAASLAVNSFESGPLGGTYGISPDSLTLMTPAPHFRPGEPIEVSLTPRLFGTAPGVRLCPGFVYRYRVGAAAATVNDTAATVSPSVGNDPVAVAIGDVVSLGVGGIGQAPDGTLDLAVVGSFNGVVTTLIGDGAGRFGGGFGAFGYSVGSSPESVALGDVNGDGRLDIVTANSADGTVTVLVSNPFYSILPAPGSPYRVGTLPWSVALGDVNRDGRLDIVTANSSDNTVTVLVGDGAGHFAPGPGSPFGVGTGPNSVALGDVNGDGKLDIVTANFGSTTVTVLIGDGAGGFAAAAGSPFAAGSMPAGVALGDVNGDGTLDLVTANYGANTVVVLLGNGSGAFAAASGSPFSVGTAPARVALGDLNGDAKLDIVVTNSGDNTVTVLLGDGSGDFSPAASSPFTVGSTPVGLAVGDVNGDGKLDIVVANAGSNTVTVLLNR
jgi:hypothetical protein